MLEGRGEATSMTLSRKSTEVLMPKKDWVLKNTGFISNSALTQEATKPPRVWFLPHPQTSSLLPSHEASLGSLNWYKVY